MTFNPKEEGKTPSDWLRWYFRNNPNYIMLLVDFIYLIQVDGSISLFFDEQMKETGYNPEEHNDN